MGQGVGSRVSGTKPCDPTLGRIEQGLTEHYKITTPLRGGRHPPTPSLDLSAIPRCLMGVAKPCLLGIYRLKLDPPPRVQFAGPEGPGGGGSRLSL